MDDNPYREALRRKRRPILHATEGSDNGPSVAVAPAETLPVIPRVSVCLMGPSALARRYGVSHTRVWQWRKTHWFPKPEIEAGRTILWDVAAVDAALASNTQRGV